MTYIEKKLVRNVRRLEYAMSECSARPVGSELPQVVSEKAIINNILNDTG